MATKRIGYGSKIRRGDVASGPAGGYVDIPQSFNIQAPSKERAEIEATDNDSPNNTMQFIQGMLEISPVTFELHLDPYDPVHKNLRADIDGVARWFQVLFPGGGTADVTCFVRSMPEPIQVKDKLVTTVTLRPDGNNFVLAGF